MKKLLLASIGLLWAMSFAYSIPTGPMTPGYTTTGDNWIAVTPTTPLPVSINAFTITAGNPLPISGTFSATITNSAANPLFVNVSVFTNQTINVNCTVGCSGSSGSTASNAVFTDETQFTPGTSVFTPIGGIFTTSSINLTQGQQGVAALTATRALSIDAVAGSNLANIISLGTGTTGLAVPTSAIYEAVNVNGNLTGITSWSPLLANALAGTVKVIKQSGGSLGMVQCYNPNSVSQAYVEIYNTTPVTVGSTVPLLSIPIAPLATGGWSLTFPGIQFSTFMGAVSTASPIGSSVSPIAIDCNFAYN